MKVTLDEKALSTLKDILTDKKDQPQNVRVYFAGMACSGPSFGLALDEKKPSDIETNIDGLNFVMDSSEYAQYGDIDVFDNGYGFQIKASKVTDSGCGGCGGGCH